MKPRYQQKWPAFFIFVAGIFSLVTFSKADAFLSPPEFSVSNEIMMTEPASSQKVVERELQNNPSLTENGEMRARYYLGSGFQRIGAFVSAKKNFDKCISLQEISVSGDKKFAPRCMAGLASVLKYSAKDLPELNKLFAQRNSPIIKNSDAIANLYIELIDGFTLNKDYPKAEQLVNELNTSILSPQAKLSGALAGLYQGMLLVRMGDIKGARAALDLAHQKAQSLIDQEWVDGVIFVAGDVKYYLAQKEYGLAKQNFENGYKKIDLRPFKFSQFWMDFEGLKVGVYTHDKAAIKQHYSNCEKILRGTEVERTFTSLINAWRLLAESKNNKKEIAELMELWGPNNALIDELQTAAAVKP